MARNLYALLVGIDNYVGHPLNGCVNDINAVEKYLNEKLDKEKYQLRIEKLLDEAATRQAIIGKFESHLCQACKDDVVLFYYCGHGSQEVAAEEFYEWEPDKKLETIVCYNSRQTSEDGTEVRDLADKEMRYLISKIAKNQPHHILVVYDCCHSGSGTRGEPEEGVRSFPIDVRRQRKYEDFLFAKEVTQNDLKQGKFPEGKHVFIAACLNSETAKETIGNEKPRGVFSYFLIKELESLNATLSYSNLLRQVNSRVHGRKKDQSPQIEPIGFQKEELSKLVFLGDPDAIKPSDPYFILTRRLATQNQREEWIINAGVNQLQEGSKLSLYKDYSTSKEMQDASHKLGEVKITKVGLDESVVEFIKKPSDGYSFYAILTERLAPHTTFYVEGDAEILTQLQAELEKMCKWPICFVRVVRDRNEEHDYRLYAREQRFEIKDLEDRLLVQPIEGYEVIEAANQINHIARWAQIRDMKNPRKTLSGNAIEIEIYHDDVLMTGSDLCLKYKYDSGEWYPPSIELKLINTQNRALFCALLDIGGDYSITIPGILPEGGDYSWIRLDAGQEYRARVFDETPEPEKLQLYIPEHPDPQIRGTDKDGFKDITEYQSVIKLIASTSKFEALEGYVQGSLILPPDEPDVRAIKGTPPFEGWMTKNITYTLVRPKNDIKLETQEKLLSLGVTIKAPDGLKANARLTSTSSATRSISSIALPPLLSNTAVFQFTTSHGVDQELGVLEMEVDPLTIDKVTPDSPIIVSIDEALNSNERILAIAQDGEFFFPLGFGQSENGKTEIKIEGLCNPQPVDPSERKFGQAIQMCFRKIVLTHSGKKSSYAWLRKAWVKSDGTVDFTDQGDLETVKTAVADANRIILYIHGIIGDTESMIPSVRYAKLNVNGQVKSLEEEYQLVLAFDYENLNAPIEDTAKELKKQLAAIGLQAGHGKTLHMVAHSMGGLVSRSYIEQLGGNEVVSHLIMFGTPNGGSPWATVHDLATTALFFGLNLSSVPIVPSLLEKLVGAMSVTLKEMHSTKASFLEELKADNDPHCPYSIIAGSTALMDQQADMKKLLIALKTKLRRVVEFPFGDNENDIAVAVKDIIDIPGDRSPAVYIPDPVACDHLSYFHREAGLQALSNAISRAFKYS